MLLFCESNHQGKNQKTLVGLSSQATVEARSAGEEAVEEEAELSSQQQNEDGVDNGEAQRDLGFISANGSQDEVKTANEGRRRPRITEYEKSIVDFSRNVGREYDFHQGGGAHLSQQQESLASRPCSQQSENFSVD